MLPSIPTATRYQVAYRAYVALFFFYLVLPLLVVAVFSFNDSMFPALPWNGFTLDWFFNDSEPKLGFFHDTDLKDGFVISLEIAVATTILSTLLATSNAFLFAREEFPGKNVLYILMLLPLVIPGVILGVSILVFSSEIANYFETAWELEADFLRPGMFLVIIGQFAFITTISTLIILARLRKFDTSLEEAALNLGANRLTAIRTVTLPFLRPAIIGAAIVSFLMSFENFNTTLILVGSDAPLTIAMFDQLKEGSTPVINAVSVILMLGSGLLAFLSLYFQRSKDQEP